MDYIHCDPRHPLFDRALKPASFTVVGTLAPGVLERLCAAVASRSRTDRIEVRWHPLSSATAGMCVPGECQIFIGFHGDLDMVEPQFIGPQTDGMGWRIVANSRQTRAERLVTLAHELAHIYCGHLGPPRAGNDWSDAHWLPRALAEVEAETVAALVGIHAGLEPGALLGMYERLGVLDQSGIRIERAPAVIRRAADRIAAEAGLGAIPDAVFDSPIWSGALG